MAVLKHAQRILDEVISSQHIIKVKLPTTHSAYESMEELPNMFNPVPPPQTGGLSQLKAGIAQSLRVNNPYRYSKTDEFGFLDTPNTTYGCARGPEIGGNRVEGAGVLYDKTYGLVCINSSLKKVPMARIYYLQQTHMHRMSSMRRANGTGGPYQILFEEDGGFKDPLDGFNRSNSCGNWVMKGFKTAQDAVSFCEKYGYGFEVEVPRHRYFTRKSYADNFKYKPAKEED